jgi:hypothetical protein
VVKLLPLLPRPRSVTTIGSGVMLCVGSRMVNPVIMVRALHLPRGILTTLRLKLIPISYFEV